MHSVSRALALVSLAVLFAACRTSGGSFLLFGGSAAPQDPLVARVHDARQEVAAAREDFAEAFTLYQRLTTPQAVGLPDLAEDYVDALERCRERVEDLEASTTAVRAESEELFEGWDAELTRFSGETLRAKSAAMLADSRERTARVLAALERVQGRMAPLVRKLEDYALFFNHNLNARAIATLEDTYKEFDAEYRALDGELATAEGETTAFLATLAPEPAE